MWNPVKVVTGWYLAAILIFSSICVNVLQVAVLSLVFLSKTTRLSWSQTLANQWWNMWIFIFSVWSGVRYEYHGDKMQAGENAILIGNHERGLGFVDGVDVCSRINGLGCGRMMTMMKDSLKYVPSIGWTMVLQGSLFLKRDWQKDHVALSSKLAEMEDGTFPRPFFVGMYPEGTRITPKKHAASLEFAKKRGLPLLQNCLLPRTKGFVFVKKSLPSSIDCVYDTTIAYEGGPAYLSHCLLLGGFRTKTIHVHVRRTPFKDLPTEEKELEDWLMDAFVFKDKVLDEFKRTGHFPDKSIKYSARTGGLFRLFAGWASLFTALMFVWEPVAYVFSCVFFFFSFSSFSFFFFFFFFFPFSFSFFFFFFLFFSPFPVPCSLCSARPFPYLLTPLSRPLLIFLRIFPLIASLGLTALCSPV